jgi:hypothetical protein
MDPEIRRRVDALSRVLAKLAAVDAVVFRGAELSAAQRTRYRPGALVEEAGLLSATLDPARTTGGNTTFVMRALSAKDVSAYSPRPQDAEVVFDRSAAFRVLEQRTDPDTGRVEILLEEALHDRSAVLGPLWREPRRP